MRRQFFIELMAGEIATRTGCEVVYAFRTARVVFFLLLLEGQEGLFLEVVEKVRRIWSDHIQVLRYQK